MQPIDLAAASAPAIHDIPSMFMLDPPTYQRGAELGFGGADFYFAGRGGVLGDVRGEIVAAAFVFFQLQYCADAYDRAASVMPRADAAAAFAGCAHEWARQHLSGDALDVVVELGTKVIDAADCAGAPLFAGWRAQPVPTDRAAAAAHQLNVLRELRGAYHAGAVLAAGLTPREAIALEHPAMAPIHGWSDDVEPDRNLQAQLDRAAAGAEAAMARPFEVLDDDESEAFATACATLHAQIAAP
jgi:hypothetical protein